MTIEDFPEGYREVHPLKLMIEKFDTHNLQIYTLWLEKKHTEKEYKTKPTKKNRELLRVARGAEWKNSRAMSNLQSEFRIQTGSYIDLEYYGN